MLTPGLQHIVVFDASAGGHNGQYMESVVRHWLQAAPPARLTVAVSRRFIEKFDRVSDLIESNAAAGIELFLFEERRPKLPWKMGLIQSAHIQRMLVREVAEALQPNDLFCMFIDHLQPALALDLQFDFPVRLSGIYCRPSFHYGEIDTSRPSLGEIVTRLRKRILFRAALRNPHLHRLFCLDRFVVPHVARMSPHARPVYLPDCSNFNDSGLDGAKVREAWKIEPGRKVALLFGVLARRKGLFEAMAAMTKLPAKHQQQLALVLAGPVDEADQKRYFSLLRTLKASTDLQVVADNRTVPEPDVQGLIRAADLVFVTYKKHPGPSNVLARAAAEYRPVLGTDYGLLAAQIRAYGLGQTVRSEDPAAIAGALAQYLDDPSSFSVDPDRARTFASEHTAENFARTIVDTLTADLDVETPTN